MIPQPIVNFCEVFKSLDRIDIDQTTDISKESKINSEKNQITIKTSVKISDFVTTNSLHVDGQLVVLKSTTGPITCTGDALIFYSRKITSLTTPGTVWVLGDNINNIQAGKGIVWYRNTPRDKEITLENIEAGDGFSTDSPVVHCYNSKIKGDFIFSRADEPNFRGILFLYNQSNTFSGSVIGGRAVKVLN